MMRSIHPLTYFAVATVRNADRIFVFHEGEIVEQGSFGELVKLAQNYGRSGATYSMGDLDGNGTVNFSDLVLLASNYGQ